MLAVDHIGVFADPADTGVLRQRFFQYRCAIDEYTVAERSNTCLDAACQCAQPAAEYFVIVATECVT